MLDFSPHLTAAIEEQRIEDNHLMGDPDFIAGLLEEVNELGIEESLSRLFLDD